MSNGKRWMLGLAVLAAAFAAAPARAEDREMTLVNVKYEGKVVWINQPLIVKKGDKVKLTLVNNVKDDPAVHGFSIPAFNVKAEVERGKPATIEFVADKAGLFDTNCQLHPGHVRGQILVLE